MVDAVGDWKWDFLCHRLPAHVLLQLAATQRPQPSFPMDTIGWRCEMIGSFRFKQHTKFDAVRWWVQWIRFESKWLATNSAAAVAGPRQQGSQPPGLSASNFTAPHWNHQADVVEAELWGIATGIELAWLLGCRHLIVESDSVARRNNEVADWLAKLVFDANFAIVTFDEPPDGTRMG
ncbi:hypothetical protein V6N11_019341 [Hibiscus sabdariffa]|uniref:RNase H type-1 domain-containing protein n=1 Tax=Hibiscus sabdariffa TaxID=183260 RepID=A0ABR2R2E1_9ROSI